MVKRGRGRGRARGSVVKPKGEGSVTTKVVKTKAVGLPPPPKRTKVSEDDAEFSEHLDHVGVLDQADFTSAEAEVAGKPIQPNVTQQTTATDSEKVTTDNDDTHNKGTDVGIEKAGGVEEGTPHADKPENEAEREEEASTSANPTTSKPSLLSDLEAVGKVDYEVDSTWTKEQEQILIDCWQESTFLYTKTDSAFKLRQKKTLMFQHIGRMVKKTPEDVDTRMKSLRSQYVRTRKKPSGSAKRGEKEEWILHRLKFLEVHIDQRHGRSPVSITDSVSIADPVEEEGDKNASDDGTSLVASDEEDMLMDEGPKSPTEAELESLRNEVDNDEGIAKTPRKKSASKTEGRPGKAKEIASKQKGKKLAEKEDAFMEEMVSSFKNVSRALKSPKDKKKKEGFNDRWAALIAERMDKLADVDQQQVRCAFDMVLTGVVSGKTSATGFLNSASALLTQQPTQIQQPAPQQPSQQNYYQHQQPVYQAAYPGHSGQVPITQQQPSHHQFQQQMPFAHTSYSDMSAADHSTTH